ncbi:GntR family transcriptional regulator [Cytobacillus oceanisediminis]
MSRLTKASLADQAYDELRRLISSGSLPAGERITERGLSGILNVSATPVREALKRLESEGLIERTGPRTLVVAVQGSATLTQRIEIRAAMRGVVARFAARNATLEQLAELERVLDESDDVWRLMSSRRADGLSVEAQFDKVGELTARFNALVAASANNPLLVRLLQQTEVVDPVELVQKTKASMTAQSEPGNKRWRDDREVFEAIRDGDEDTAERIMIKHVRAALTDVLGNDADESQEAHKKG